MPPASPKRFNEISLAALLVAGICLAFWAAPLEKYTPGSTTGLWLGATGLLLMLSSEVLLTLRKRLRGFHFGATSTWLQAHIVTGIVGPCLVILHSAGKFQGLAGLLALLTMILVVSGFVGRHIYTAIPRTLEGDDVPLSQLDRRIDAANHSLTALGVDEVVLRELETSLQPHGWRSVLGRAWFRWRFRRRVRRWTAGLKPSLRPQARQLIELLEDRYRHQLELHSLATARRRLALWHAFHVPLGAVVFMLAFIHTGAALYYAFGRQ